LFFPLTAKLQEEVVTTRNAYQCSEVRDKSLDQWDQIKKTEGQKKKSMKEERKTTVGVGEEVSFPDDGLVHVKHHHMTII
jgi:hypothetical protein